LSCFLGLTDKEYRKIKDELDNCTKPLYFFHDDADGLSSFLQVYRYKQEGKGIIIKTTPNIDTKFLRKVEEYSPDKIFVLDIAAVEQDFIDSVNVPIIWIDHHGPYLRERINYFNPRKHDKDSNPPVSYLLSKVVDEPDDDWIAMTGMVGDWFLPPDYREFSKKHPKLLPKKITRPEDALFGSLIGRMAEIFNFILKGTTTDAINHVKVLTRINSPDEILEQTTNQGRFIYKRYEYIKSMYDKTLADAKKYVSKSKLILYKYTENKMSFTSELSNELLYLHPEKIVVIARDKSGEMKCSFRSSKIVLPLIIERCLSGLEGRGGGHEHACGAVIKKEDFDEFISRFRKEIGDK